MLQPFIATVVVIAAAVAAAAVVGVSIVVVVETVLIAVVVVLFHGGCCIHNLLLHCCHLRCHHLLELVMLVLCFLMAVLILFAQFSKILSTFALSLLFSFTFLPNVYWVDIGFERRIFRCSTRHKSLRCAQVFWFSFLVVKSSYTCVLLPFYHGEEVGGQRSVGHSLIRK